MTAEPDQLDLEIIDANDNPVGTVSDVLSSAAFAGEASGWYTNGQGSQGRRRRKMELVLWIIAVVLVISGILAILRRQLLYGIVLIVVGLLVGPGGVSIFT